MEERRSVFRQAASDSRQAMQRLFRRGGAVLDPVPPVRKGTDANAADYMIHGQDKLSLDNHVDPFREPRIPELRGLRPAAMLYNAQARAREIENARRANAAPPPAKRAPRSFFDSFIDLAKSILYRKRDDKGVWLCSLCTTFLDTMNPPEQDRATVERIHQRLGIWPPFERVQGVNMAIRECARCKKSRYAILFAYFDFEE